MDSNTYRPGLLKPHALAMPQRGGASGAARADAPQYIKITKIVRRTKDPGHTGRKMPGHNRDGCKRRYWVGKRNSPERRVIWKDVPPCKVNGGSDQPKIRKLKIAP